MILSPEILNAFVDGELDPRERAQVERALSDDAAARRTVEQLRRGSEFLRSAYREPLRKPMPSRIEQLLAPEPEQDRRSVHAAGAPARDRRWFPAALAAAVAALALTAPASYFLAEYHVERKLAAQAALIRADYELSRAARLKALEKHISGQTVSWTNPDSGSYGGVTPVRTFKTSQGQWCREYVEKSELIAVSGLRKAVACRDSDGRWEDRLEILSES